MMAKRPFIVRSLMSIACLLAGRRMTKSSSSLSRHLSRRLLPSSSSSSSLLLLLGVRAESLCGYWFARKSNGSLLSLDVFVSLTLSPATASRPADRLANSQARSRAKGSLSLLTRDYQYFSHKSVAILAHTPSRFVAGFGSRPALTLNRFRSS